MQLSPKDTVRVDLATGHKHALKPIKAGENVIKYGFPIGHATCDIAEGEWVHSHNLATNLSGTLEYTYTPIQSPLPGAESSKTFMGYLRPDGSVGIRNDIWIVNTVGCVNNTARILAEKTGKSVEEVTAACERDNFMTSEEAKEFGIIDRVLERH